MKKQLLLILLIALGLQQTLAQQVLTNPRPVSPMAEISQTIGIAEIDVQYSRPKVTAPNGQNRTDQIWGQLVPYGLTNQGFGGTEPAPWRAGANENTVFTIDRDIKVEGKSLRAGTYGLHLIVNESGDATYIFSNNSTSWGSYFYKASEDALRVNVSPQDNPFTEVLTYQFTEYTANSTVLVLDWEKKRFPLTISVDTHSQVLANMENELRGLQGFFWKGYNEAAQYCLQNNIELEKGLAWATRSVLIQKNFNNMQVKAGLLTALGKLKEGEETMKEALTLNSATVNDYYTYGRQLINQKKNAEAMEIFKTMNKKWPEHWLSPHGLARAYSASGDYKKAKKLERIALEKAPDQSKGFIKQNLEKLENNTDFN